jgi:hypothetical protein
LNGKNILGGALALLLAYGSVWPGISPLNAAENVTQLGLKGDGETDDTDMLQQVLNGAHGDLYFPPGRYLLGSVSVPADTRLVFDPKAQIKVNADRIIVPPDANYQVKAGKKMPRLIKKPLFEIKGDRVRIEGLSFDFASGGNTERATPVEALVGACGVNDLVVSRVYATISYPREAIPLEKRTRGSFPTTRVASAPQARHGEFQIILKAEKSRNIVLENSGATYISHMIQAEECENVSSHGNWMIEGNTITTFSQGSGNLRHFDNWSRNVTYQVVWRGGAPDPSRKSPVVPLGTANIVQRDVKEGDPMFVRTLPNLASTPAKS